MRWMCMISLENSSNFPGFTRSTENRRNSAPYWGGRGGGRRWRWRKRGRLRKPQSYRATKFTWEGLCFYFDTGRLLFWYRKAFILIQLGFYFETGRLLFFDTGRLLFLDAGKVLFWNRHSGSSLQDICRWLNCLQSSETGFNRALAMVSPTNYIAHRKLAFMKKRSES